jgi:hypothetical protein
VLTEDWLVSFSNPHPVVKLGWLVSFSNLFLDFRKVWRVSFRNLRSRLSMVVSFTLNRACWPVSLGSMHLQCLRGWTFSPMLQ